MMLKKWRLREGRGIVILFFLLFFVYGCMTYRDYGISVDEPMERVSSLVTWLYLHPELKDLQTDTVNFSVIEPLRDYQERYYGVAIMLPCVWAEHLTGFTMPLGEVFYMRHLYNFLLFFVSLVFFYLLCREFVESRMTALLGVLFLVLTPRILADSFYNLKDLMFLSLFVIDLYFCVRFLKKSTPWNTLAMAAVAALCVNVRVVGGYLPVICVLLALAKGIWERKWARQLVYCLAAALTGLICYIAVTPITWADPVQGIIDIILNFANYLDWYDYNYYMGQYITKEEIPWHYLPVWIAITTPLLTLVFSWGGMATEWYGMFRQIFAGKKKGMSAQANKGRNVLFFRLLLFFLLVLPIAYAMIACPTLYNGWRHYYFLCPVLCLYAMLFADFCVKALRKKERKQWLYGFYGLVAAGLCLVVFWIGSAHPYEYVYFNEAARAWAYPNFDKDYWGVSERDALEYICDHDDSEEIKVFILTDYSLPLLNEEDRNRIVRVTDMEEATYYIHGYHAAALGGLLPGCEDMEPWHHIKVDGYPIRTIYKR